jgi:hypothetical protein
MGGLSVAGIGIAFLLAVFPMTALPLELRATLAALGVVLMLVWPLSLIAARVRSRSGNRMISAAIVIALGAAVGGLTAGGVWWLSERAEARVLRQLYLKSANPAADEINLLAEHLDRHLRTVGGLGGEISRLLDYPRKNLASARMRLNPDRITEDELYVFYRAYQDLVNEIRQVGIATRYDFRADGNYTLWKRHDSAFMKELYDLIVKDEYRALQGIFRYMWPDRGEREYWAG